MGQEDARRDGVYWLVQPLAGKRIPRLVQSTHHQGAQALANTHRLALAALVTPIAWSVATMHTAIARSEFDDTERQLELLPKKPSILSIALL